MIDTCSIVMTKTEWLKLPEKIFIPVMIPMGDDQRTAYWEMQSQYTTEIQGKTLSVDTPLVLASKLMQISNGFAYLNPDADDLSFEELFGEAEKMIELLTGKLSDRKAIVWYNMTAEKEVISKYLTDAGISFEVIMGGEKDVGGKVRRFNSTPALRCLVCQARSVNYGITVMGMSKEKLEAMDIEPIPGISSEVFTQIFYSLSFSLEMYLQQQDRIHRIGQKHVCEYYILLSQNPMETRVMKALEDKQEIKRELLVDIVSSLTQ
jgi:SNF2 family DNA or RNA helicase